MRVLVTGAAGCLGRVLIPELLRDPRITQLIAHDRRPVADRDSHLQILTGDVRDPALRTAIKTADAVVHMAFVVIEGHLRRDRHDRRLAHGINIDGTRAVLDALNPGARLIQLSSASVYGTSARALTESAPLAPLPGFRYAEDKAQAEELVMAAERGGLSALRLRPHIILGPHAQPFLRGTLRLPFYPKLPEPAPLLQIVHEHDVAAAIAAAIFSEATGALNLACADALSFQAMQKCVHGFAIGIDPKLARLAAKWAFRYAGIGPDPAWTAGLDRPLILDTTRARVLLGWRPRFARTTDVLVDTFARVRRRQSHLIPPN